MTAPRASLASLCLVVAFVAACDDDDPRRTTDAAVPSDLGDAAVAPADQRADESPDLALRRGDLGDVDFAGPLLGCHALVDCGAVCERDAADDAARATCVSQCDARATNAALDKFNAALTCAKSWCLSHGVTPASSAPSYKCKASVVGFEARLINLDGTVPSPSDPGTGDRACYACLSYATAALFGGECTSSDSPDCDPVACASERAACLADLP